MNKLTEAIRLAALAHDAQIDKLGEPYILHPLAVMLEVPPAFRVVAVLHDVVEDTPYTLRDIERIVGLTEDERTMLWLLTRVKDEETYNQYIKRMTRTGHVGALLIKRADLRHNVSRLEELNDVTAVSLGVRYTNALNIVQAALTGLVNG